MKVGIKVGQDRKEFSGLAVSSFISIIIIGGRYLK